MEQKLKNQLGELIFMVMVLQDQLEQAQAKIAEFEKEKND